MYNTLLEDIKSAMKTKDSEKLSVLRLLYANIKNSLIDNSSKQVDDKFFYNILSKYIKELEENIENYSKLGRVDLVDKEEYELKVLKNYLPTQLTDEEIYSLVKSEVDKISDFSIKNMGEVINNISKEYEYRVTSKKISEIIRSKFL